MQPFLKEVAEEIVKRYSQLDALTIIFPNRRAALFFRQHLSESIQKPAWSPKLLSVEEFFRELSDFTEPDRLSLIFRLYHVYSKVMGMNDSFDRFYFWGEMLLRDFDEVDKYGVDATFLFKDLSRLKELDETFDYLTDEQKEFLMSFWITFQEKPSLNKDEFLKIWSKIPDVYEAFKKSLKKDKLAYEGMLHRDVVEHLNDILSEQSADNIIFVGFNALTKTEEQLMVHYVEKGARVFWDEDTYYVKDKMQEAGQFLRQYRQHAVLGKTFPEENKSRLTAEKKIKLTGVPQRMGQAKLIGEKLKEIPDWNKAIVVLPDESMLLPVLNSLPASNQKVNVTMGYPLRNTPLYNLLDVIIELQAQRRDKFFSHRQVTAILAHAYVQGIAFHVASSFRDAIIKNNRVFITVAEFETIHPFVQLIFQPVEASNATAYLLSVIEEIGSSLTDSQSFDREYAFHFHRHLSRLHEILSSQQATIDWRGFQKLFRQVVLSQKIPFTGEPLEGLQIMGVLETRNLDFEHVFILSMNEGMLPASAKQGSYIPNSIRRAYSLPSFDHQDAIYAYLFYRLLQRASEVELFYNTEPDIIGNGEMSRYVQQLLYEVEGQAQWKIKKEVLHHSIHLQTPKPITIDKTEGMMKKLSLYMDQVTLESDRKYLSPSALNDYIECRLKFYFKHIARLREADEIEEDMDYRIFGNLFHDIVHWFYEELQLKREGKIEKEDFDDTKELIHRLTDNAFLKQYPVAEGETITYEGQRIVVREVILQFVNKVLELDREYAPFTIRLLEEKTLITLSLPDGQKINVGGKVDRADVQEGIVRIIDYKTGGDETDFESIDSLFRRDKKRNKAAFQTLLYASLYERKSTSSSPEVLRPGLLNRNIFKDGFTFGLKMGKGNGKNFIDNAAPLLPEFEAKLIETLSELFNQAVPFDQTTQLEICKLCPYKQICYR